LGALSASAFVGADNYNQNGQQDWGSSSACPPASQQGCNKAPQCGWGFNPPAYTRCGNVSSDFSDSLGFRVDFLYWRPSVDQLAIGNIEKVNPLVSGATSPSAVENKSYVKRPGFDFEPGFRLGIAHFCPCDSWDVALNWTHFHSKASTRAATAGFTAPAIVGSLPTNPYQVFVPYWERVAGLVPDDVDSRWTLESDMLDLEFGYRYYVTSCLVLRPHAGLRGGRINQSVHVSSFADRETTLVNTILGPLAKYKSEVDARNDFLAVGPRVGLDIELDIGCGFSIVGQGAASILFGTAKKHASEVLTGATYAATAPTITIPLLPLEYKTGGTHGGSSRTISDLAIGLKWDHCVNWCNRSHPLTVAVLWEHHCFFNFNQYTFGANGYSASTPSGATLPLVTTATNNPPVGDLFTQGLTVALGFGF